MLDFPLHPPTQGDALADAAAVVGWVRSWQDVPGVVWTRRRWADVGDQALPERLRLDQPDDVARFAARAAHWRVLSARADELLARWGAPVQAAVRRHARSIAEHEDADHARLVAVVEWLVEHPRSGLFFRQVPVAGVDTKWLGSRRALVTALVTAVTGEPDLGLLQPPGLVRSRFLDTTLAPGGLAELATSPGELDRLTIRPDRVIVIENLESMLALPSAQRTIAVHGSGYAVDRVGAVGWLRTAPITYWGDLDRDGFAILDRLRTHCSDVTSVLMDKSTLLAHRDLWVADPNFVRDAPSPRWERLTVEETTAASMLYELGGVRLEQERLAWPTCLRALGLTQATTAAGGDR